MIKLTLCPPVCATLLGLASILTLVAKPTLADDAVSLTIKDHRFAPADVRVTLLAGDPIRSMLTSAPGNGAPIGGLKVMTANGWFAARPSGTEDVYKLYAESFRDRPHLERIQAEGRALISDTLAKIGAQRA